MCIVFVCMYLLAALSLEARRHSPAPLSAPRPPRVWHSRLAHTLCKSLCKRVCHILCATQCFCTLLVHSVCVTLFSVQGFCICMLPCILSIIHVCSVYTVLSAVSILADQVRSRRCPLGLQLVSPGAPSANMSPWNSIQ